MLINSLHALLALLCVAAIAEALRQRWRGNRCRALAERRKEESAARSHDHREATKAIDRIRTLADREAMAGFAAWGFRMALVALACGWAWMSWRYLGGT